MKLTLALAFLLTATTALAQSHGHINAGAADSNASGGIDSGDKLFMYFETGTRTTTLASNAGAGAYGLDGFLWNGYTTFTSLHQSSDPAQSPNYNSLGALSGSFLRLDLVGVAGPAGARLAFYESGAADPAWVYQIGTGFLVGDGSIALTEQSWFDGAPSDGIPSDPYGHIHGRMFGVDTPGDFTATWVLTDTRSSITGLQDSAPFTSSFTTVPEPAAWMLLAVAGLAFLLRKKRRPMPVCE